MPSQLHESYWAAYLQDTWRVSPVVTLSLGLRYEYFSPFSDQEGRVTAYRPGAHSVRFPEAPPNILYGGDPDPLTGRPLPNAGYYADKNNLAPRVGLAYSPRFQRGLLGWLLGSERSAIRLGYGVYYDIGLASPRAPFLFTEPFDSSILLSIDVLSQLSDPFTNPIPADFDFTAQFSGRPFPFVTFDPSFRTAYLQEWSLSVQRELAGSWFIEMAYVGRSGTKLLRATNLNPGPRDPNFDAIIHQESSGTSSYHGLQVHVTRRFRRGFQAEVSYSLGKALDTVANIESPDYLPPVPNLKGRSSFDRRQQLVANFIYELPSPRPSGWVATVLGGWQVAGILSFRSGAPLTIRQYGDPTGSGTSESFPDVIGPFRRFDPREIRTFVLGDGITVTGNFFFDPTVFRQAVAQGTLGRNVFSGPGINNWDMALLKRTRLGERLQLELRLDASNAFNHTQFTGVAEQLWNPFFFGQANTFDTARKVQFGAKLHF